VVSPDHREVTEKVIHKINNTFLTRRYFR